MQKCIARTWGNGVGARCTRRPRDGSEFCGNHANALPHGRIDEEQPPDVFPDQGRGAEHQHGLIDEEVHRGVASEQGRDEEQQHLGTEDAVQPATGIHARFRAGKFAVRSAAVLRHHAVYILSGEDGDGNEIKYCGSTRNTVKRLQNHIERPPRNFKDVCVTPPAMRIVVDALPHNDALVEELLHSATIVCDGTRNRGGPFLGQLGSGAIRAAQRLRDIQNATRDSTVIERRRAVLTFATASSYKRRLLAHLRGLPYEHNVSGGAASGSGGPAVQHPAEQLRRTYMSGCTKRKMAMQRHAVALVKNSATHRRLKWGTHRRSINARHALKRKGANSCDDRNAALAIEECVCDGAV